MSSQKNINKPTVQKDDGAYHPINQIKDLIMDLLISYGFEVVDGPEVETEIFNFDMLNIKKSHPARQMHDTFMLIIN